MLIVAGGYEGGLVGVEAPDPSEASASSPSSINSSVAPDEKSLAFRFLCSQGSIRCLALGLDFLCCGGSDETVQVYGLRNRKKHGDLLLSDGCITSVGAVGTIANGLLLIGNEHGLLHVYSVRHLNLLKQLKGHKRSITSVSVHPNGELALSVSEDATVRLWDLKTFVCVFYSRLNGPSLAVEWHSDGKRYYILSESQLLLLSLSEDTSPCVQKAGISLKYCCATWVGDSVAVGCKSGAVVVYSPGSETPIVKDGVHTKRIKAITSFSGCIVTADSDGMLVCASVASGKGPGLSLSELWRYDVEMRVNALGCCAK
ncbi:p21-activated protein kinase-interacting protein 1-like [Babesia sp. Xinjiang]|uniref:p21-activated protein kinase-interacting protein 1-like n=1 Tax=Babesia sp. Xinjiang TaxID=462227 RepID=UPI000A24CFEF|nr:p21-activated protein kinase-interacting protein 1-like [Babesia sp. Xinjiang]ORM42349.1 p21-activated protein kinase-interacting protein 1-like [Babesia sp. Xinjiang]